MIAVGFLAASTVLQLTAAGLALRLVRATGWWLAWVFVSAALVLVSLRCGITLYRVLVEDHSRNPITKAGTVAQIHRCISAGCISFVIFCNLRNLG